MFKVFDTRRIQTRMKTLLLFTCVSLDFLCTVNFVNQEIKPHKSSL